MDPSADMTIEELTALGYANGNHPSFEELHREDSPPAANLVDDHLNNNVGLLFTSRAATYTHMGQHVSLHP